MGITDNASGMETYRKFSFTTISSPPLNRRLFTNTCEINTESIRRTPLGTIQLLTTPQASNLKSSRTIGVKHRPTITSPFKTIPQAWLQMASSAGFQRIRLMEPATVCLPMEPGLAHGPIWLRGIQSPRAIPRTNRRS